MSLLIIFSFILRFSYCPFFKVFISFFIIGDEKIKFYMCFEVNMNLSLGLVKLLIWKGLVPWIGYRGLPVMFYDLYTMLNRES